MVYVILKGYQLFYVQMGQKPSGVIKRGLPEHPPFKSIYVSASERNLRLDLFL